MEQEKSMNFTSMLFNLETRKITFVKEFVFNIITSLSKIENGNFNNCLW